MSTNPLVAGPVDTATATSGMGLIDDIAQICTGIHEGNWVDVALGGVAGAADAISTAIDPVGSLIAWGIGWVLDHVEPLKGWLNDLTGDAGAIIGFAGTWTNVAKHLTTQAQDLSRSATSDLSGMYGLTISSYFESVDPKIKSIGALANSASAIASGLQAAAMLVQFVHDLVRDTISQIIGSCASALAWAATGVGIPYAISIVSEKAAALSARITAKVTGLVKSLTKLKGVFRNLDELIAGLKNAGKKGGGGTPHPGGPGGTPGGIPKGPGGGGPSTYKNPGDSSPYPHQQDVTDYQNASGHERAKIAERMGENGGLHYLQDITGNPGLAIRRPTSDADVADLVQQVRAGQPWDGPVAYANRNATNLVYWDGQKLHVVECKGGDGTYGSRDSNLYGGDMPQTHPEYPRDVAQDMKKSPKTDGRNSIGEIIDKQYGQGNVSYVGVRTGPAAGIRAGNPSITLEHIFL